MSDFQQNTITNRQAVLDYIDANSGGGGGGSQTLSDVLTQGQTTGNQAIFSPDLFTTLLVEDGGGSFVCTSGSITYGVNITGVSELSASDGNTSELSRLQIQPTQAQFTTNDTTGNLYSELLLRSDYTTLTYFDNDTSKISQLSLDNTQSVLVYNIFGGVNNTVDVNANQAKLQFDDVTSNGIQGTFLASQASITATFNDVNANVQSGFFANHTKTEIYYTESPTIENTIRVDQLGYYIKDVPAHDDNAAAITAGLTAGYIFKTTGSGAITTSGVLCIVQ
jgi:hypothetical protein